MICLPSPPEDYDLSFLEIVSPVRLYSMVIDLIFNSFFRRSSAVLFFRRPISDMLIARGSIDFPLFPFPSRIPPSGFVTPMTRDTYFFRPPFILGGS